MIARRVVSLVPSVTESLVALGAPPVACTRFCEQPGTLALGGTKDPDVPAIIALSPDVVVMNDEENRRADYEALRAAGIVVVDVSPRSVAEVGAAVRRLAGMVEVAVPPPFDRWDEWVRSRCTDAPTRTAVTMVWRRPWMVLGRDTYGASLLAAIGIATPRTDPATSARYPEVTWERVRAVAPGMVVLPSEPYPFAERHRAEVETAVPGAAVELVDGRDLFWWGTRTPDALTRLAARLG